MGIVDTSLDVELFTRFMYSFTDRLVRIESNLAKAPEILRHVPQASSSFGRKDLFVPMGKRIAVQ